jgi:hypothetical protein
MKYLLLLFSCLFFFSCNNAGNQDFRSQSESAVAPALKKLADNAPETGETTPTPEPPKVPEKRMLVKTATLSIHVEDIKQSKSKITALTNSLSGYISSESESTYDNSLHYGMELRIPNQSFDKMMSELENLAASVESRQVNVQDVTAEYVDVQARLEAKKAVEQSYINLLKQARNMDDILKIQEQLGVVRGDIESMQGQLNLLGSQVQYSTIHLEMIKTLPYTADPGKSVGFKFRKALSEGWSGFVSFLVIAVYLWPFILLLPVILLIIRWVKQRRKNKVKI